MSNSAPPNKINDLGLVLKIQELIKGVKSCDNANFTPDSLRHKNASHHSDTKTLTHSISKLTDELTLTVEINLSNQKNFKFRLDSDQINIPFFRYDSVGTPHRNRKLPLDKKDSIHCPHFNTFDEEGYYIAYRTEIIEKQQSALEFIDFALNHFLKEGNIDSQGNNPTVDLPRQLFLVTTINPLEGINF